MNVLELRYLTICKAVKYLSIKCDNISIPIKPDSYDLVVDAKNNISRIRVVRTDCRSPCGSYVVSLRKGFKKNDFEPYGCEFLFVDSPEGCYLIPRAAIKQSTGITLSGFKKYLLKPIP